MARYLEASGFGVVARNLRLGRLEIDVVARRRELIVVVEVRARSSSAWTSGHGSVDRAKRERIRRAGQRLWQRRYQNDPSAERLRFDSASVLLDRDPPEIDYVAAAF